MLGLKGSTGADSAYKSSVSIRMARRLKPSNSVGRSTAALLRDGFGVHLSDELGFDNSMTSNRDCMSSFSYMRQPEWTKTEEGMSGCLSSED